MTADAATLAPPRRELPSPLVHLGQHPLRWLSQFLIMLPFVVVLNYMGFNIAAALYYIIFEWNPFINHLWHMAIPVAEVRHAVRDVGEGLFGKLAGTFLVLNRFAAVMKNKKPGRLDQFELDHGYPNLLDDKRINGWDIPKLIYRIPMWSLLGFSTSLGIVLIIRHDVFHVQTMLRPAIATVSSWTPIPNGSLWSQVKSGIADGWPNKLMGYAAAFFFGHRPAKAVFADVQLWMCEQRYLRGRTTTPWYFPPTWKATFNDVKTRGIDPNTRHAWWLTVLAWAGGLLALALVGYGFYVMNWIAKA